MCVCMCVFVMREVSIQQGCPTSRSRSTSRSPIDPKSIARGEKKKKKLKKVFARDINAQ